MPNVEVRFENLNVMADVQTGSRALPTLINYTRDVIEVEGFFFLGSFELCVFCKYCLILAISCFKFQQIYDIVDIFNAEYLY